MVGLTHDTLVIGTQVCLRLEELHPKGRMEIPNSKVVQIKEDAIYIQTPVIDSRHLEGRRVDILWEKGMCMYCLSSTVQKCIQGKDTMLVVSLTDMLRCIDKRHYFRLKGPIYIEFRPQGFSGLFMSVQGKDISGKGIRFLTNYPLMTGQKLEMLIEVPIFPYLDASVLGEVACVEGQEGEEGCLIDVRFLHIDPIGSKRLFKYILDEQQPLEFKMNEDKEALRFWFSLC